MKTSTKLTKTIVMGLLLASSNMAWARVPAAVDSGREGGGFPPVPNATHIVLTQTLADGLLASSEWQDIQTLVNAQSQFTNICAKAFYESDGQAAMKIVGANPADFEATSHILGIDLPAGVQFNDAIHFRFCESLQFVSPNSDEEKALLTNVLGTYGDVSTRHSFSSMRAESMTCVGPWDGNAAVEPACFMTVNSDKITRMDPVSSMAMFNYLSTKGNIQKLHGDAYFVRNLSCSEMEIMNPMARRMVCTYEAPIVQ